MEPECDDLVSEARNINYIDEVRQTSYSSESLTVLDHRGFVSPAEWSESSRLKPRGAVMSLQSRQLHGIAGVSQAEYPSTTAIQNECAPVGDSSSVVC